MSGSLTEWMNEMKERLGGFTQPFVGEKNPYGVNNDFKWKESSSCLNSFIKFANQL